MEWGIYRKNDQEKVLQWIGDNEDLLTWCELTGNLKLPEELQPVADQRKAERKEKYLESLSEDDREEVLAREGNRERKRERKEAEYQKWRKDGHPGSTTILDMIKEEPKKPEEVEEVFPWEKG